MTGGDKTQTLTTVAKPSLPCPADNCGRELKNNQTLKNHMARFHDGVVQQVKNFLLSPRGSPLVTPSSSPGPSTAGFATPAPPSATAPSSSSAPAPPAASKPRQLFDKDIEDELQKEMEVMLEAAKEEQELFDALEQITDNVIEPDTEKNTRDDIKETLKRFKVIMTKKDKVINVIREQVKSLKLSTEAIKHDSNMQDEVLEEQKKDIENVQKKNDKMAKEKAELLKELKLVRELNGNLNKTNHDMTEKLKVKENLVKALKEELGVEDDNEVEEEEESEEDEEVPDEVEDVTEPVVRMNKDKNNHTCNACNKKFRTSQNLENHVQSKHVEKKCDYCENVFENEHELAKHHEECDQIGLASKNCNKCDAKLTIQGLRRHKPTCHGKKEFDCPDCGMIFSSNNGVKKHQDEEHKMETVRSREVCFHWRRGNCVKGNLCRFSHVGSQNHSRTIHTNTPNTRVPLCKNGASCDWLAKGSCSYFHPRIGVQKPWTHKDNGQGGRQDRDSRSRQQPSRNQTQHGGRSFGQDNRPACKFDGRCEKIPNCPDIHSMQVFPVFQGRRNTTGMRNQGWRRN